MTTRELESLYVEWLNKRFDPEDKEQLAVYQAWLEREVKGPKRCVTVEEVVAWQRLSGEGKRH
jgi:hypothetical protein